MMMRAMKKIFPVFAILLALAAPAQAAQTAGIAAVVNDDAISMTDVQDRIKLVIVSSGLPDSPEIRSKILPQVVEGLIEEQLKLQEAHRHKLEVSEEEVEDGLKTIADQNHFTPEQFVAILEKSGVPKGTLISQIKSTLAWNKVIKDVLRRQVDVSDTDVNVRMERLKSKIGQTEYLVSQIYLPLDNAKRNAETIAFAGRMAKELQAKKAPFGAVAAQFSKAAGADKGGTLGWIQTGQLGDDLDKVLVTLEPGDVSDPVRTQTGLYILALQKKRTFSEESIPPRDELTNSIGYERLDRVQQRTLLDLKSAAFIDRRV
ncbi:MAG: rotamase [Micavibrio aeruginosavorus]|uniref:Rotamase n=1 Tax=Micavibrio aeruginosavorus TaxID=349221 RepID=A0A2W5N5Q4_9BACT|nr:MAG: rotamase [Micavibrio aeruginosavorus]